MTFALVTCLDSNLDLAPLLKKSPELQMLARAARPLGKAFLMRTDKLLEANSKNSLFFGFDEVWFFPGDRLEPKPDSTWLVGPGRIDQLKIKRLVQRQAKELGCC
jgi:hypothetical protein